MLTKNGTINRFILQDNAEIMKDLSIMAFIVGAIAIVFCLNNIFEWVNFYEILSRTFSEILDSFKDLAAKNPADLYPRGKLI